MKACLFLIACVFMQSAYSKIYTWEDERGKTIFSNVPPKTQVAEEYKFKNEIERNILPLTAGNIIGKWKEIVTDGNFRIVEFNEPNEVVVFQYADNSAFYKADGTWLIGEDGIQVRLTNIINQKSNFRSKQTVRQDWHLDSLNSQEITLIIEGELIRFGR
ncbi:DUF4124 domain-containing protein [Marinicellulosiphila megalodicopiae]|uniref:DUF4124 domain-containing protein n=1 Tax=Marinicellulosiphila megalodicopiae TaxID=2724896 RepID=UPI003BAFB70D